jgi:hypothetical protein
MSPTLKTALIVFLFSFVYNVAALKMVPSQMAAAGWTDTLFPPAVAAVLTFFTALGIGTAPVQKFFGLRKK